MINTIQGIVDAAKGGSIITKVRIFVKVAKMSTQKFTKSFGKLY